MRRVYILLGLLLPLASMGAVLAADQPEAERVAKARQAARALGEALKKQLVDALAAGGPVAAVDVCKTVAPELARQISGEQGMSVKRTALRVRNPANAPDAFERKPLEQFLSQVQNGADPATLEYSKVVTESGRDVLRYMKAIPMVAEPCQACHGPNLKAEVKEVITRLYPSDAATGFKPGELRGAFSIIVP